MILLASCSAPSSAAPAWLPDLSVVFSTAALFSLPAGRLFLGCRPRGILNSSSSCRLDDDAVWFATPHRVTSGARGDLWGGRVHGVLFAARIPASAPRC